MDRSWQATFHGIAKSQTQLSNSHTHIVGWATQVALVVKNLSAHAGDAREGV